MKKFTLVGLSFIFTLLMITTTNAQILNSQTDVENFVLPSGGIIIGDLEINDTSPNDPITSLEPLQGVVRIIGDLTIENTEQLQTLEGLEQLKDVRGLRIQETKNLSLSGLNGLEKIITGFYCDDNIGLQNLEGLNNVKEIKAVLIRNNQGLASLQGLNNLKSIGQSLWINYNNDLTNLEGLNELETIGLFFLIRGNDGLINLEGLDKLKYIERGFVIDENTNLSNFIGLNALESVGTFIQIKNNNVIENLMGFEQLKTIGTRLTILDNDNLQSMYGLNNLESIGTELFLRNNKKLESLSDLENLSQVSILTIYINPELCDCDVLTEFVADSNVVKYIASNKYGCSSNQEILDDIGCCPNFLIVGTCGWKYVNNPDDICTPCSKGVTHLALMIQDDNGPLSYQGENWRHASMDGAVGWFIDVNGTPVEIHNGAWLEIPAELSDADITHAEIDYFLGGKRTCIVDVPWKCSKGIKMSGRSNSSGNKSVANVVVSPNPASTFIRMNFDSKEDQNMNLKIFNPLGEIVYEENIKVHEGPNEIELNLSLMKAGIHFYQLSNGKMRKVGNIVKILE